MLSFVIFTDLVKHKPAISRNVLFDLNQKSMMASKDINFYFQKLQTFVVLLSFQLMFLEQL